MNQKLRELGYQALHDSGLPLPDNSTFNQFLDQFTYLIGEEVLAMANRHGNIKPRRVEEYFGSDE